MPMTNQKQCWHWSQLILHFPFPSIFLCFCRLHRSLKLSQLSCCSRNASILRLSFVEERNHLSLPSTKVLTSIMMLIQQVLKGVGGALEGRCSSILPSGISISSYIITICQQLNVTHLPFKSSLLALLVWVGAATWSHGDIWAHG